MPIPTRTTLATRPWRPARVAVAAMVWAGSLLLVSCEREERDFRVQPPSAQTVQTIQLTSFHAGTTQPAGGAMAPPTTAPHPLIAAASTRPSTTAPHTNADEGPALPRAWAPGQAVVNQYEHNAYALSEGKRLFSAFNCVGCHFHGGGGIGPPLMDAKWIYGSNPEQIFATIVEGRPNGMPSFRGRIADYQVWQIAAYVRSLSGLARQDAAPGRDDAMKGKPPENSINELTPIQSTTP